MRGACGSDAGTMAHKVIAAVAVQDHIGIVDGNNAVTVYIYAAEVIRLRIHLQAVYGSIGDRTGQYRSGNRLLRHVLAVRDYHRIGHLKVIDLAMVLIVYLHCIGYGQYHIAGIGARLDLPVDTVYSQRQAFACGRGKDSIGGDGQRSQLLCCLSHITAANGFFIHRKLSFWRKAPGLDRITASFSRSRWPAVSDKKYRCRNIHCQGM